MYSARLFLRRVLIGEGLAVLLHFKLDLTPDVREFLLQQGRRQIEAVFLIERVEQLALQLAAGMAGEFALHHLLYARLEISEAINAKALGEFVIQLKLTGASMDFTVTEKLASLPARFAAA